MVCCSVSRAASPSTYGSSVSTTIRHSRAAPAFAGASSANARTRRPSGGSFVAGSPGDDSPGTTGSRSPTSAIPPWSLPSRWSGYTPTACIASPLSLTLPARRLPTWSIAFSLAIRLVRPSGSAQPGRAGWLDAIKRRWRKLGANREPVGSTNLRVKSRAGPQPAFLRDRIARDETELRAIALRPLEIVEARPVKIAAHRDPRSDGAKHRPDMRQEKIRPPNVGLVRDAVLGYENWQSLLLERTEHPVQTFGVQLPVQVRSRRSNRNNSFSEQLSAISMIEPDELSRVVVQPKEVLARNWSPGLAGASEGECQPAASQRLQDRVIEHAIECRGHNAILGRERAGRVKDP